MNSEAQLADTFSNCERHLRELVDEHTVHYVVNFMQEMMGEKIFNAGFEIDLLASHNHGSTCFTPGCKLCLSTFHDLHEIATWIIPKESGDCECVIEPYDSGLHFVPAHSKKPEVLLVVKIEHRQKKGRPIDDGELCCLSDMESSLKRLGVHKSQAPGC